MRQNEIIVIRGLQMAQMAYELCERADLKGMIRSLCRGKDPLIALKPNILGPIPASEGATTHPEIIEGVVTYLRGAGFGNLAVMESSWVGDKTSDALLVTGIGDLCRRLSVPFYDLKSDGTVPVDCAGMQISICRMPLEADYLISLPVMKGHCQTLMTCALKNMKGCLPDPEKRRFHRMGLHEPIAHLAAGIRQDFILADAICPDVTFEDGGNPVRLDRMLCGVDPVLVDAYACSVMGLREDDVPYIRIAEECGAGTRDLSAADLTFLQEKRKEGKVVYQEDGQPQSRWIESDHILEVKELVKDVDSCSACYGTLIPVLQRLEEEGVLADLPHPVCIGQGWRGKKGKIGIGSCTSRFEITLSGCPPTASQMEEFLRETLM